MSNLVSRGTQTDPYELYINGMMEPKNYITKDGYTFKYKYQSARVAFYDCSSPSCKQRAYVMQSGQVLSRGPDHNHEKSEDQK